ncbi:MAG: hypothetical protein NT027_09280 [Proteobacteria bacterium]|nr:hypothetical protein [Pseudomonadota bacterium]
MSTVHTHYDSSSKIGSVFHYGKECLTNRWKPLLILAICFILIPRIISGYSFALSSKTLVDAIRNGSLSDGNLIMKLESLLSEHGMATALGINFLAFILALVGLLAISQMCLDYFEQNPTKSVLQCAKSGGRVLLLKGFGAAAAMVLLVAPMAIFALLRVILLCLLTMLPLEMVGGHRGGFGSVTNTIFLRYAALTKAGRWPAFSNVMTFGGLALSAVLLYQLGLGYLLQIDVNLGILSSWWVDEVSILGSQVSISYLVVHTLELLGDTAALTISMPFFASLRFHAQKSSFSIKT